jgi:hypothetical protein
MISEGGGRVKRDGRNTPVVVPSALGTTRSTDNTLRYVPTFESPGENP